MAESIPITKYKDLGGLRTTIPQFRRKAVSKRLLIKGFDTETNKGDIFLIADSDGNYLDDISPKTVLDFLYHKRNHNSWNFFYHIGYDAEVICKLLGKNLFSYKETGKTNFEYKDYIINYIPAKKLAISKGHHSVIFFDIWQFYLSKLSVAYQENIGSLDASYLSMKEKRDEFSLTFYSRNKKRIRDYCVNDCILTKELSEKWIDLFYKAFGFYCQRWLSSGYLAEKILINNNLPIPMFDSVPYEIQDLAWRSYVGGRFEIIRRGFIGKAYLYDINSAYPFALSKFPDISNGEWIKSKSINKNSLLGFFKILADIRDHKIVTPFPFNNGRLIFPSGKFITYVTLAELLACESPDFYKILDSYQFISNSAQYQYQQFVENMYNKRMSLKEANDDLERPFKVILNSIYGKTAQKINRRIGNLFNPIIASFITGFTRAQLYRFVIENGIEKDLVSMATDSICTTKRLDCNSDRLGEFSFDDSASDVFFVQNGVYRFNNKWKKRGFGKLGNKTVEHAKTIIKNGKIIQVLEQTRASRLRQCILENRIQDIGKIDTFERELDLNADHKRLWLGDIESMNTKNQYYSMPISLNYFEI